MLLCIVYRLILTKKKVNNLKLQPPGFLFFLKRRIQLRFAQLQIVSYLVNKLKCIQNSGSKNNQAEKKKPKQANVFMNTCQETIYNLLFLSIVSSANILIIAVPGY